MYHDSFEDRQTENSTPKLQISKAWYIRKQFKTIRIFIPCYEFLYKYKSLIGRRRANIESPW
jgi:hypothetical protein